jgi:hypothetical protein
MESLLHTEDMHRVSIRALVLSLIAFNLPAQQSVAQTSWPATPPAQICGNTELLSGPATPPPGAIVVPAGPNNGTNWNQPGATFWFAPGVHTFGDDIYGQIIPGNDTTFIGAPGAVLDGQNLNLYAFTQQARNVTIRYLEIRNFGTGASNNDEGTVNSSAGENWTIEYNYIHDNDGAGVMIGSGNTVRYNCLKDNGQYGFNAYHKLGVRNVVFDHNEVTGNNQDDWESRREGCGCTGGGKFWDTRGAVVTNNWVHDNLGTGLWADYNNSEFLFEGNYIENNDGVGLFYEISYNFMIRNNTFKRNAIVTGRPRAERGDPFPSGAIYISESGGDARAGAQYVQSEISGNYFENNWDGVVLWENADRFCRPGEASDTTNNCPFFERSWGTRFRTQNISVHDNEFRVDKAAIGCTNARCGRMGLFSQYGSHPANSPYLGNVIQQAITFEQNNRWFGNAYHGPWRFVPFDMSSNISFATWQAGPYNQDAGSTFDGDMGPPSTEPPGGGTPTPSPANFLDADTSTLEGSLGKWEAWYGSTISRATDQSHSGASSLLIAPESGGGWAVALTSWPGFAATAGTKRVSYWAKSGTENVAGFTLRARWFDASGQIIQTDLVPLGSLTTQWQQAVLDVVAPAGTTDVRVELYSGSASAGSTIYVDDLVIKSLP